jgi:hypothetical protein
MSINIDGFFSYRIEEAKHTAQALGESIWKDVSQEIYEEL